MFENGSKRPPTFEWWHCWKQAEISAVFLQLAMVVWKWQKTDHQPFSGDFVGKRQKFLPFSNNHNQLFENGRKQTINNFVGTLLENGRNFGHFPTTGFRPFSNNPKCFGRFPTKRFRPFSYNFFRPFSTSPLLCVLQSVEYAFQCTTNTPEYLRAKSKKYFPKRHYYHWIF